VWHAEWFETNSPDLTLAQHLRAIATASMNVPMSSRPPAMRSASPASLTLRASGGNQWLPLTQRLQAAFAARVERLPPASRTALTLLALHDSDSLPELVDALNTSGTPTNLEVLEPAMAAGLIELSDGEVHFRHPLMRAAVYNLASSDSRATGHLALAEAVGRGNDRGVLHRAQAATGSDDGLAVELELVADRAVGRGAVSAAVMTLARAAELTSSAPDKRRYLFQAAVMAYELGQADAGDAHRAGGAGHYEAYLASTDGFEVELVAAGT
jgi:predicted ATPase